MEQDNSSVVNKLSLHFSSILECIIGIIPLCGIVNWIFTGLTDMKSAWHSFNWGVAQGEREKKITSLRHNFTGQWILFLSSGGFLTCSNGVIECVSFGAELLNINLEVFSGETTWAILTLPCNINIFLKVMWPFVFCWVTLKQRCLERGSGWWWKYTQQGIFWGSNSIVNSKTSFTGS